MLLSQLTKPDIIEYVAEPVRAEALNIEIEEKKVETLEEQIARVAVSHNIPTSTLYNLAESESSLGEERVGDNGKSCGVIHFHKDYYPEENSRCDDDEYILNRAAEMIAIGEGSKFTPCNCYSFAKLFASLPKMADIVPNTPYPRVGDIIILQYRVKHIAVITKVTESGIWVKEANYIPCKTGSRLIEWGDKNVKGYYTLEGG